jgi:hypothetical protein
MKVGFIIFNKELVARLNQKWKEIPRKAGDIASLPSKDRLDILFIIGRTIDNSSPRIGKIYEIIRERRNDEDSRILEFKELDWILGAESLIESHLIPITLF